MGQQRRELGGEESFDRLDVIDLVGLPQQKARRPVRRQALLGKEVWVAGGHDALHGQKAGVAVVGMEAVALPGIMAEHDVGSDLPDHPADLGPLGQAAGELTVDVIEEDDVPRAEGGSRRPLLLPAERDEARPGRTSGPTSPSSRR